MAITVCVKPLAVPGPTPGPWEESAGSMNDEPTNESPERVAARLAERAKYFVQCEDGMTIPCSEIRRELSEDASRAYADFNDVASINFGSG
jgi:hypothetical protein